MSSFAVNGNKETVHWWGSLSREGFIKREEIISSLYADRVYPIERKDLAKQW